MIEQIEQYPDFTDIMSPQADEKPTTLISSLQIDFGISPENLTTSEQRAIIAADAMPIPTESKRVIFMAHLLSNSKNGVLRPVALGIGPEEPVNARDTVKLDPEYNRYSRMHELLMIPKFAEVAVYKRANKTYREIVSRLTELYPKSPTEIKEVERILKIISRIGITGETQDTIEFGRICEIVEAIDAQSEGNTLPRENVASSINTTSDAVTRARQINRLIGRASSIGKTGVIERDNRIAQAIKANPHASAANIASLFGTSINVIEALRKTLIAEGLLKSKRTDRNTEGHGRKLPTDRQEAKTKIKVLLDTAHNEGRKVVLRQIYKEAKLNGVISYATLKNIYKELAEEQAVPKLDWAKGNRISTA